jgi:hypothetical protein
MRIRIVNDAIFDIGHRLNLSFAAISNPGALKRKMLAFILALCAAGDTGATDLAAARRAEVSDLDARLLSQDSATAVLGAWCRDHHLAADPTIRAERDARIEPPSRDTLKRLGASDPTQIRYRHVRLMCGTRVLSDAENWYRPDVLTPEMNRALETSRTPFGVVVAPLGFHRATLSTAAPPAGFVLRHRAVLTTSDGRPFSVVVETYTRDSLGDLDPK